MVLGIVMSKRKMIPPLFNKFGEKVHTDEVLHIDRGQICIDSEWYPYRSSANLDFWSFSSPDLDPLDNTM